MTAKGREGHYLYRRKRKIFISFGVGICDADDSQIVLGKSLSINRDLQMRLESSKHALYAFFLATQNCAWYAFRVNAFSLNP